MSALVAALLACASPAQASFPGADGKSVGQGSNGLVTFNPDGSGFQEITTSPGSDDRNPMWSANGQRIAFDRFTTNPGQYDLWIVNSDGTGLVNVTQTPTIDEMNPSFSPGGARLAFTRRGGSSGSNDIWVIATDGTALRDAAVAPIATSFEAPKWSPDGGKIAFFGHTGTGLEDIWTVNADDGTGLTNLTQTPTLREVSFDWSPDGSKIVYDNYDPSQVDPDFDIHVMNRDGTNPVDLTPSSPTTFEAAPLWAPSGGRIFFHSDRNPPGVWLMRPDGTGPVWFAENLGQDIQPAAVPAPSGPARAKTASPMFVPLVPAYRNCTAPDRAHGGGLSYQSCSNPTRASQYLTVGTPDSNQRGANSTGFVRYTAIIGDPLTTASEADVRLEANVTDVRGASTLADYLAELRVTANVRLTQRVNPSQTVVDFPFNWSVGCSATPDPNIGSTCATVTSANAVIPGSVVERDRASWELGQIQVQDGGDDGVGSTESDNTVFMRQGIFVP
jgi:hypothetical protein